MLLMLPFTKGPLSNVDKDQLSDSRVSLLQGGGSIYSNIEKNTKVLLHIMHMARCCYQQTSKPSTRLYLGLEKLDWGFLMYRLLAGSLYHVS